MLQLMDIVRNVMTARAATDQHLQAAIASGDVTAQRQVTWDNAKVTYGDYATHLSARLGTKDAWGITHQWQDRTVRAAAANKHDEGFTHSSVTDAAVKIYGKKTNTCQIFAGRVAVTNSQIEEAKRGRLGDELKAFVADQVAMETRGILKDMDAQIIEGVEDTSDPRSFKGLAGLIATWNGFIQTNRIDCAGALLAEAKLMDAYEGSWNETNGQYAPNALYCSLEVARVMKGWTDKVTFMMDVGNPEAHTLVKAGQAVGYYQHQAGVSEIFIHPSVAHDGATAANNFLLGLHEPLISLAFLRPFHQEPDAKTADEQAVMLKAEGSLECMVEKAHFLVKNFAKA